MPETASCRECRESVSTNATRCPHCRARHPAGNGIAGWFLASDAVKWMAVAGLAVGVMILMGWL